MEFFKGLVGIHESKEKVLADAGDSGSAGIWNHYGIDRRICHCAVYLFNILTAGKGMGTRRKESE